MPSFNIHGIIIYKLNSYQELCLMILFKINKNSKISLYYIVLPLDLAVDL